MSKNKEGQAKARSAAESYEAVRRMLREEVRKQEEALERRLNAASKSHKSSSKKPAKD